LNHVVSLTSIATGASDANQSRDANAATLIGVSVMVPGALPEKQQSPHRSTSRCWSSSCVRNLEKGEREMALRRVPRSGFTLFQS
jgi:hypothetical protein